VDVILHWNVRKGRLVGASRVKAQPVKRVAEGEWWVELVRLYSNLLGESLQLLRLR
jgi:hypothetical protein